MTPLISAYTKYTESCDRLQNYLNGPFTKWAHTQLPPGAVQELADAAIYSFAVSLLISRGSPLAALKGMYLGFLAKTFETIAFAKADKWAQQSSHWLRKPLLEHTALFAGCLGSVAIGKLIFRSPAKPKINFLATFLASVPLYVLNQYRTDRSYSIIGIACIS